MWPINLSRSHLTISLFRPKLEWLANRVEWIKHFPCPSVDSAPCCEVFIIFRKWDSGANPEVGQWEEVERDEVVADPFRQGIWETRKGELTFPLLLFPSFFWIFFGFCIFSFLIVICRKNSSMYGFILFKLSHFLLIHLPTCSFILFTYKSSLSLYLLTTLF